MRKTQNGTCEGCNQSDILVTYVSGVDSWLCEECWSQEFEYALEQTPKSED